ncbi:11038_t:CDS:2 [Paraglomus brasilianum]|uniref:40S ribosomal protein S7 n=1 Tax=Paraglomus brasilianum TaxID=144538 RepID=A0A9N9CCY8_9GLOM|nr:11038_t:CDS:2 [Paraglomus brasilianum]
MAENKIAKPAGMPTDELEHQLAQALYDLENNVTDFRKDLKPLQFKEAKEYEIGGGKKAIVVKVSVPKLKLLQRVQQRLTRELEKKFADRHVVFIGDRRILRKPGRKSRVKQARPRSRTLTAVHEKWLEDLVYPTEIVGQRTLVRMDGSRLIKVFLDNKDSTSLEYKLDTFAAVYRKMTGKDVFFDFRQSQLE